MPRTVLIVDDEALTRRAMGASLIRAGFEVVVARDGEEGLRLALEKIPDVVILDMLLPKMDGLKLCRALKADRALAATRVFLVSGVYRQAALAADALEAGCDAFLSKPVDMGVLIEKVRDAAAKPVISVRAGNPKAR
jgi:two-component system NtrC family sensor kinase